MHVHSDHPTIPVPPGPRLPPPPRSADERRRSLPVALWIAMAGAVAFGGTLGAMSLGVGAPAAARPSVSEPAAEDPASTALASTANASMVSPVPAPPNDPPGDPAPALAPGDDPVPEVAVSPRRSRTRHRRARPQPSPSVDRSELPPLGAADVRPVVQRQRPRLQQCYDRALRRLGYARDVRVELVLDIGADGAVSHVAVHGDDPAGVQGCLAGVARRWHFPESRDGARVPVPLAFTASD